MTTPGTHNSRCERVFSDDKIALIEDNPFHTHCVVCRKVGWTKETLKLCTRCMSVAYCSRECQIEDYQIHKGCCKGIEKMRTVMEIGVAQLQKEYMDDSMSNVMDLYCSYRTQGLEQAPIPVTDYWTSRLLLTDRLMEESTSQWYFEGRINEVSLATYLEHWMDMLTLVDASSVAGAFRPSLPDGLAGVMIFLGKYQQAYDFLKFCLSDPERVGNIGHAVPVFLQRKGANMVESLELLPISRSCNLCQVVEMALLKLYVFGNVRGAQLFAQKSGFDRDILSVVGSFLGAPEDWPEIDASSLLYQTRTLLSLAKSKNRFVLLIMLVPLEDFKEEPVWMEIRNAVLNAEKVKTRIGRWWMDHKVANNFLVNFVRNS